MATITATTDTVTAITNTMASLTLTVPLAVNQNHSSVKTLLGLPRELREAIYHHTLVSPPKHSLEHASDCPFRHGHTLTSIEPAACMVLEPKAELVEPKLYAWDNNPSQCRCAKRMGLNLLLACRRVHREAAPIFWSRNDFVFENPDEFAICVGARLREEYRPLLRGVYVAGPAGCWDTAKTTSRNVLKGVGMDQSIPRWTQFWGVLKQCAGLRRLAVRPEVVRKHSADMKALARRLPELERLELTWLGRYKDQSVRYQRDWGSFRACTEIQRDTVFVQAAQVVEIRGEEAADLSPRGCKELFRDFTTNFCVYVDRIVRERFLGCPDPEFIDFHGGNMAAGLDDLKPSHKVDLPNGKTARVTFMGLPQSKKTRLRLAREKKARDAKARALGRPTVAEEKVLKEIRGRRDERKVREVSEEQNERVRVLSDRREKAERIREDERREVESQRAEVRRAVEENKAQRRLVRKRAGRGSVGGEEAEEERETEEERVVPRTVSRKAVKESKEEKRPGKKRGGSGGKGRSRDDLDDYEMF